MHVSTERASIAEAPLADRELAEICINVSERDSVCIFVIELVVPLTIRSLPCKDKVRKLTFEGLHKGAAISDSISYLV